MFCAAVKLIVVEVSVLCCHQVDSGGGKSVLCCHQVDSGGGKCSSFRTTVVNLAGSRASEDPRF